MGTDLDRTHPSTDLDHAREAAEAIANMETVIIWQNCGGGVETWLDIDRKAGEMTINEGGQTLTVQGIPSDATIARWQAQGFTD